MTDCFQHNFYTSGDLPCPQCETRQLINKTWAIGLPLLSFIVVFLVIMFLAVLTQK